MGILDADVLLIDDVPNLLREDGGIADGLGRRLATYELDQSTGSRMTTGVRSLVVREDGVAPFMRVARAVTLGRCAVTVQDPTGAPFLTLHERSRRQGGGVAGQLPDGRLVECAGAQGRVLVGGWRAAQLSEGRNHAVPPRTVALHTRADLDPGTDPLGRAAVVACALALELVRIKETRRSSGD